jgi:hypothetical protein
MVYMRLITIVLVSVFLSFGANQYILDSELKTNFSDNGSSVKFLTAYTYDSDGNRIQQRVWNGTDSITSPMSTIRFSNNSSGAITEAINFVGNDTSSIVRYSYSNEKLTAVHTLTKTGALRFADSLIYDVSGRNVEEQRISSSGVKTFFHRYAFNAQGKRSSDSLYELSSGTYIATQTIFFTYNTDFTVASEVQWRLSGNNWYCISTASMTYSSGSLVAVVTHERDGAGTAMLDSISYSYDIHGNRIKEEKFDGTSFPVYRIDYTWHELPSTFVSMDRRIMDHRFSIYNKGGHLFLDYTFRNRGQIAIYNMAGKRICATTIDHSGIAMINGLYGKGSYIAIFTDGAKEQAINFTIS